MKSFGIWASYKEGKPVAVDVHANLWHMRSPFFDLGVMIPECKRIKELTIALPFKVEEKSIVDLSSQLKEDGIGSLVFNTKFHSEQDSEHADYGTSCFTLNGSDQKILLLPVVKEAPRFGIKVEITEKKEHTCITVNFQGLNNKYQTVYLRFRIKDSEIEKGMFCRVKRKNKYLESAFKKTQIIDFTVNELRSIDTALNVEMIGAGMELARLRKVHLFVMEMPDREVSLNVNDCRRLENGWEKYLGDDAKLEKCILVYHWKKTGTEKEDSFESFNKLVKVTCSETNWRLVLIYVLLIILFSIIANFCWSIINSMFNLVVRKCGWNCLTTSSWIPVIIVALTIISPIVLWLLMGIKKKNKE